MPHEPLLLPAPTGRGGRTSSPQPSFLPGTPFPPAQQSPVTQIAGLGPPVKGRVFDQQLRDTSPRPSGVFRWYSARPLGIRINNGLDAEVRIRVFVSTENNAADPPVTSAIEIDAPRAKPHAVTLSPQLGDPWAEYVWCEVAALSVPTAGGLSIDFTRQGD